MFQEWNTHITQPHLYPTAGERDAWEALDSGLRGKWIAAAEKYAGFHWPSLPAADFMAFVRNGDRTCYEKPYFERRHALETLVLGECIEGKGRFLDDIINGVWAVCEESFWGVSAHNGSDNFFGDPLPDIENVYIDLFAAETGGLMAHLKYLLGSRLNEVSPIVCRRIDLELERRIKGPFLARDDFWWMGNGLRKVNNWTPWIVANVMSVFLLEEPDQPRRDRALKKMMACLDRFTGVYHSDGGCDEGTSYWSVAGGALFDCLDQLYRATDGKADYFQEDLIKQIGRFLYRSHISGDYYINFADGGARVSISRDMIWRYGKRIGDQKLEALALSAPEPAEEGAPEALRRSLPALFGYQEFQERRKGQACPPYVRDVWMDGIQVMAARQEEGSGQGLYLAAKGGNNGESHNHNDVGSCIIFFNGIPGIIDVGVETYSRRTFSDERYSIWTMQSQYHNLPTINGQQQLPGADKAATRVAYTQTGEEVRLKAGLEQTYPAEAGILGYDRVYQYLRGGEPAVIITDKAGFQRDGNRLDVNFMSWKEPVARRGGLVAIPLDGEWELLLEYDAAMFQVKIEACLTKDARLYPVWGDQVYRIVFTAEGLPRDVEASFTIR